MLLLDLLIGSNRGVVVLELPDGRFARTNIIDHEEMAYFVDVHAVSSSESELK
jgi:hypothetical protein